MSELLHGDCMDILPTIADNSVDLVVTDPPYRIITGGDCNGKNSVRPKGMLSGNRKLFDNIPSFSQWMPEVFRILKEGTHCYVMSNTANLRDVMDAAESAGFKLHNILVWEKNNCTPSQYYMKNCEYTLFLRKGAAKYINNIGASKTVHRFNNVRNKQHPTEKPVELMSFYIENSSNPGDTVLDPFMGCGSTGVAALQCQREFIGIEKDAGYFDIAQKRIAEVSTTKDEVVL